jgi:hypothetical protein
MEHKISLWRVLLKTLILLLITNFAFSALSLDGLGWVSIYNALVPGRERFPFGESPAQSYNLSLYNFNAHFASHVINGREKRADELRVVVLGDSSTWGTLLCPEETLVGQLNARGLTAPDGREMVFYNLGYPTLSLTKDLLFLEKALDYQPDLVVWLVTLESFPRDGQFDSPLLANNGKRIQRINAESDLGLEIAPADFPAENVWDRTLIGRRRDLADLYRLQVYGVMWWATGIDQSYPGDFKPAARDLESDGFFHGWEEGEMIEEELAFDVIEAGYRLAGEIPILLVNEPILVSGGENSDIRYNFYYPRWAYDQYREMMQQRAEDRGWNYVDAWDMVPGGEFTNTAIHTTPYGVELLADGLESVLRNINSDL